MANSVCEVLLTENPLREPELEVDRDAGAVVEFKGVVRELEDGREIEGIDYEAHFVMADYQLRLIAETAAKEFQLNRVIIHHRIGFVAAGEPSLFVHVKSRHRAAAFEASKWVVEELKKKVPIWKGPRIKADPAALAFEGNHPKPAMTVS